MFQNISRDFVEEQDEITDVNLSKKEKIIEILKKVFSKENIIMYALGIFLSIASFGENLNLAPFGIALIVAYLSNCKPIGILSIIVIIINFIRFGPQNGLNIIFVLLLLLLTMIVKMPKYEEEKNEKRKLTLRLFIVTFTVNILGFLFKEFLIYDFLVSLISSIAVCVFYKIFTNGISVLTSIFEKRVYSIEEVMSASLMVAICISPLGDFNIFGFNVRNILCILIVMVMGWKNGILVGATTGITIGTVLGIVSQSQVVLVASYALSGMIAGIFSKLGKVGVIIGFILGNVLLTYVYNGNVIPVIVFREILIASLGLLVLPKNMKINIADLNPDYKLLPETTGRTLEENKDTIYKLNSMSETISDIAKSYKEAAATILDEEELNKQEEENFKIFEKELQNNINNLEDNVLFEDYEEIKEEFLKDVFKVLIENEILKKKELLDILEKYNCYIVESDSTSIDDDIQNDINEVLKAINDAYKVNKVNFIWKKKLDENKKTVSNQLEEVSKAIGKLAKDIEDNKSIEEYIEKEKSIKEELEELNLTIQEVHINKESNGKLKVEVYTNICQNVEKPDCNIKKMTKLISKIVNEKVVLQKQECGLRTKENGCKFIFGSDNKMNISIGVAKTTKKDSEISGDTSTQAKLEDGKYLIALSDGMGSRKRSKKK